MATNVPVAKEDLQRVVDRVVVFNPCSLSKYNQIDIPLGFQLKNPSDYLESTDLACNLVKTRQEVLNDPRAQKGGGIYILLPYVILALQ